MIYELENSKNKMEYCKSTLLDYSTVATLAANRCYVPLNLVKWNL